MYVVHKTALFVINLYHSIFNSISYCTMFTFKYLCITHDSCQNLIIHLASLHAEVWLIAQSFTAFCMYCALSASVIWGTLQSVVTQKMRENQSAFLLWRKFQLIYKATRVAHLFNEQVKIKKEHNVIKEEPCEVSRQ